jgi:glycosyltransferase involved in cell wall biosynthesis
MNQGIPVIASTAVGAAAGGLVRNGETGLVVPEGSVAGLSVALRRILTDSDLALRLRNAGRREVAQWTNDRMTEGFVSAANYALGTVSGSRDRLPIAAEKQTGDTPNEKGNN